MEVRLTCCRKIAPAPAVTIREGHRYWNRTIDVRPILHGLDHVTGWCSSWPTKDILFLTFNNYRNVMSWKYTESVCILKERSKSVLMQWYRPSSHSLHLFTMVQAHVMEAVSIVVVTVVQAVLQLFTMCRVNNSCHNLLQTLVPVHHSESTKTVGNTATLCLGAPRW